MTDDTVAALKAAREAINAALQRLEANASEASGAPPSRRDKPRWVTLKEAADYCHVNDDTMARRSRQYGLGRRVCGKWQIDLNRCDAFQEGQSYTPIKEQHGRTRKDGEARGRRAGSS